MTEKPDVYRTSDGRVFMRDKLFMKDVDENSYSQLTLHNDLWWWDVGCPVAPKGAEENLPLYDE